MIQKIVVLTQLNDSDVNLILCGTRLAILFNKELCLFYHATGSYHPGSIDEQLKKYQDKLHAEIPGMPVSILVGNFRKQTMALVLADEYEAILLVAGSSRMNNLSSTLQNSPVPFIFVSEVLPFCSDFSRIIFPVDLRPQNKDAMKWAYYFGKHNKSEIIAIGANDTSRDNIRQVTQTMVTLKKMAEKSGIPHKIYRGTAGSLRIYNEGLEAARELGGNLMLLLGSSTITILDLILGLPEAKIVRKADGMPVLVVNPRRETYLVCE